ncbi:MAG: radical SAM protein [Bacteroidota bacterium]|nr:radical SAM protein [Bacteroidota bacterium]
MERIKFLIGTHKWLEDLRIQRSVFLHYTARLLAGKIKVRHYARILKRLLYFFSKMKENKYVKIGRLTKVNLYVPFFPTKAFYTACDKVTVFDEKMPAVSVLISVTSACRFNCEHCYQKYDKGKDVDIEVLVKVVRKLQDKGVAFFNIEGGEPFLVFDRLLQVCNAIDDRSEILINSTGFGMTPERLKMLRKNKNLMGVMFSLHTDSPEKMNAFMGNDEAWSSMVKGIAMCHAGNIPVMFNTCLLPESFKDGTFERILDLQKQFGGCLVQLIKPKTAGGWLHGQIEKFNAEDAAIVKEKVTRYNQAKTHIGFPFVYCMLMEEEPEMFGCTAGGTDRFYINAKGDLQPCEFLNFSFGNVATDDFDTIYYNMRTEFHTPGQCLLCDQFASEIYEKYLENGSVNLPLKPELSEQIYAGWDRGEPTRFYEKLSQL